MTKTHTKGGGVISISKHFVKAYTQSMDQSETDILGLSLSKSNFQGYLTFKTNVGPIFDNKIGFGNLKVFF